MLGLIRKCSGWMRGAGTVVEGLYGCAGESDTFSYLDLGWANGGLYEDVC